MKRAVSLLLLSAMGCTTAHTIELSELRRLDGYRAPESRPLRDADGEPIVFGSDSELVLETRNQPQPRPDKFLELHVDETTLAGTYANNERLRLQLADLQRVEARTFSQGKTTALFFAVVLVALSSVVLVQWASVLGR